MASLLQDPSGVSDHIRHVDQVQALPQLLHTRTINAMDLFNDFFCAVATFKPILVLLCIFFVISWYFLNHCFLYPVVRILCPALWTVIGF